MEKELTKTNKKRIAINKKTRQLVKQKTNGMCAYCGCNLHEKFHIDHILPIAHCRGTNNIDNLFAACIQCNNYKSVYTVEQFRSQLQRQVEMARSYSVNFRFAEKFGQIEVKESPIIFYFEKILL